MKGSHGDMAAFLESEFVEELIRMRKTQSIFISVNLNDLTGTYKYDNFNKWQ